MSETRHEELAALAAVGYAKFSGEVGVCLATSGPGGVHLLNGRYDAKLDHVPVVAIVGQTGRTAIGGHYQQELDPHSLFKDVGRRSRSSSGRARGAAAKVREVADLLGAGVVKALLGKDVLPDDESFVTGSTGLLGTSQL